MDEEIPDSDAEEYLPMQLKPAQTRLLTPAEPTDSISPFSVPAKAVASTIDPISSSDSAVRPSRPKPKPTYKGAPGHPSNLGDSSLIASFSDSLGPSLSDRVKMRNRGASKPSVPGSTFSSSSSSAQRPPANLSSEIIEIDSSDDELASNHQPKTVSKKAAASSSSNVSMPNPRQPTTFPSPSQLPPSDPFPQSTGTSRYQPELEGDGEGSIPPIATLTAAGDTSFEPDSSPSRLPPMIEKARPRPRPRPKKVKLLVAENHDELPPGFGLGGDGDRRMMPPPIIPLISPPATTVPFGVGTGSTLEPLPDLLGTIGAPPVKVFKKRKKQGGDEGDSEKPARKPRTKKAKKDAEGGEGGGEGKSKKKKGKGKEKEKEEFKSAEFILDDDDDDLVPPAGGAPSLPLPSLMDGVLSGGVSSKPVSVISIPDSQPDDELVPLGPLMPLTGTKRKRVMNEQEDEQDAEYENVASKGKEAPTGKKAKKAKTSGDTAEKTKKKAPTKKAKGRTVMSGDEGDAAVPVDPVVVIPESSSAPLAAQTSLDTGDEVLQAKVKATKRKQAAKKTVMSESEGELDDPFPDKPDENSPPRPSSKSQVENTFDGRLPASPSQKNPEETPKARFPSIPRHTVSRTKSTPLSELIAKVSARPGSPFPPVMSRSRTSSLAGGSSTPTTSYSPFNKFSRTALSRIAPLHPNRRTPPPPLPPPPPKPKTKKEKEREERWEEEMIEAVGGWDEWKLLSEQQQKDAKRAKWARELEGWED